MATEPDRRESAEGSARQGRVRFGEFVLDRRSGELLRQGAEVHLAPQVFRLLDLLVSRADELVSRKQLREALWPEGTFVAFDLGLNHFIARLRAALDDHAERSRFLVTVPRRGYRFRGPVETLSCPQVLAVLPFVNLDHDPGDDTLAAAMTDAVTTGLAGNPHLRVLSRQSVLHLKGCERSLGVIGAELGADTVIEGTACRAGSRLRVTAQLVRVVPEAELWADRFEGELTELFALEDRVARAIVAAVESALGIDAGSVAPADPGREAAAIAPATSVAQPPARSRDAG